MSKDKVNIKIYTSSVNLDSHTLVIDDMVFFSSDDCNRDIWKYRIYEILYLLDYLGVEYNNMLIEQIVPTESPLFEIFRDRISNALGAENGGGWQCG